SGDGVCWLAPPQPPLWYRGLEIAPAKVKVECWPLDATAWAQFQEGALRVWSSVELLGADPTASFMHGFASLALAVASGRRDELGGHRPERDDASFAAEGGKLAASLDKLARVGRAERLTMALETGGGDLARALAVINEASGVTAPRLEAVAGAGAGARLSE